MNRLRFCKGLMTIAILMAITIANVAAFAAGKVATWPKPLYELNTSTSEGWLMAPPPPAGDINDAIISNQPANYYLYLKVDGHNGDDLGNITLTFTTDAGARYTYQTTPTYNNASGYYVVNLTSTNPALVTIAGGGSMSPYMLGNALYYQTANINGNINGDDINSNFKPRQDNAPTAAPDPTVTFNRNQGVSMTITIDNAVAGHTYNIVRTDQNGATQRVSTLSANSPTYTDRPEPADVRMTYTYTVQDANAAGVTINTNGNNQLDIDPKTTVTFSPSNGNKTMNITLNNRKTGVNYYVWRRVNNGAWEQLLGTINGNNWTQTPAATHENVTYTYQVRDNNNNVIDVAANTVSNQIVVPAVATITNVQYNPVNNNMPNATMGITLTNCVRGVTYTATGTDGWTETWVCNNDGETHNFTHTPAQQNEAKTYTFNVTSSNTNASEIRTTGVNTLAVPATVTNTTVNYTPADGTMTITLNNADATATYTITRTGTDGSLQTFTYAGGSFTDTPEKKNEEVQYTYTVASSKQNNNVIGNGNNKLSVNKQGCDLIDYPITIPTGCVGDPNSYLEIAGSQQGVTYEIFNVNNLNTPLTIATAPGGATMTSVVGNSATAAPIRFYGLTNRGTYQVRATYGNGGCQLWMSGTYEVRDYSQFTTISDIDYCQGELALVQTLHVQNAEKGVTYTLYSDGSSMGNAYSATAQVDNGQVEINIQALEAGKTYVVYAQREGCSVEPHLVNGTLTIKSALPTEQIVITANCNGNIRSVSFNAEPNVVYDLYEEGNPNKIQSTTNGAFTNLQAGRSYYVVAECGVARMVSNTISFPEARNFNINPTQGSCAGETASFMLSGSDLETDYYVYLGGQPVAGPFEGTGYELQLEIPNAQPGNYTVRAFPKGQTGACPVNASNGTYTVAAGLQNVTIQSATECTTINDPAVITLTGAQNGITYLLYNSEGIYYGEFVNNRIEVSQSGTYYAYASCTANSAPQQVSPQGVVLKSGEVDTSVRIANTNVGYACDATSRILTLTGAQAQATYTVYRVEIDEYTGEERFVATGITPKTAQANNEVIQFNLLAEGTYAVGATVNGCTGNDAKMLDGRFIIKPSYNAETTIGALAYCADQVTYLSVLNTEAGVTYFLYQGNNQVMEIPPITAAADNADVRFDLAGIARGTAIQTVYTVKSQRGDCELHDVSGSLTVVPSPGQIAGVGIEQESTESCLTSLTLNGTQFGLYYYLSDAAGVYSTSKQAQGPTLIFDKVTPGTYYVYATPVDPTTTATTSGVCQAQVGTVVVAGAPTLVVDDQTVYYCSDAYGTTVNVRAVGDMPTGSTITLYRQDGTQVLTRDLMRDNVFDAVTEGNYYAVARSGLGCETMSTNISVVKYPNIPTLESALSPVGNEVQSICMSTNGAFEYTTTIYFPIPFTGDGNDGDNGNTLPYNFTIHIQGSGVNQTISSDNVNYITNVDNRTYTFAFTPREWLPKDAQGNYTISITLDRTYGDIPADCQPASMTFNIQRAPTQICVDGHSGEGTMNVSCDPNNPDIPIEALYACDGDEITLTAAPVPMGGFIQWSKTANFSRIEAVTREGEAYVDKATIVGGTQVVEGGVEYYLTQYYARPRSSAEENNSCPGESRLINVYVKENPMSYKIPLQDYRWRLCEDSDPVALSDFYDGAYKYYVYADDGSGNYCEITEIINGSAVIDPQVFTPNGIDVEYAAEHGFISCFTARTDADGNPIPLPTGQFRVDPTKVSGASATYHIIARSAECPDNFYLDEGYFTVNAKNTFEVTVNADDCYCTNDLITVQGVPNVPPAEGYGYLYAEGKYMPDQPADDGLTWQYTFSPVLRYRGNANGYPLEFTYEYKDDRGCVYTAKKISYLYQPVADEIFFGIEGLPIACNGENPDPIAFQKGFSEDFLCPDDNKHYRLVPYVFQYQQQNDGTGNPVLAYDRPTSTTNVVTYNEGYAHTAAERIFFLVNNGTVAQADAVWPAGYSKLNDQVQVTRVVAEGYHATYNSPWGSGNTFVADVRAKDGALITFTSTIRYVRNGDQCTVTEEVWISEDATYTFNNGDVVSALNINEAVIAAHGAYLQKLPRDLSLYTNPTTNNYYYNFEGVPVHPVFVQTRTLKNVGANENSPENYTYTYTENEAEALLVDGQPLVGYYYFVPSEIGNDNTQTITLYVDNGSECRGNQNDQCRASVSRPIRISRHLKHNMCSSYCSYDDNSIPVTINYPSRPLTAEQTVNGATLPTADLISTYNYNYEGVCGTSTITIRKVDKDVNGNPRLDANGDKIYLPNSTTVVNISYSGNTAEPIVTYDNNGIGVVNFDLNKCKPTEPVSFNFTFDGGASGEGTYDFYWEFVDAAGCVMDTTWSVEVISKSAPFGIYHGTTFANAQTPAQYPSVRKDASSATYTGGKYTGEWDYTDLQKDEWFDADGNLLNQEGLPEIRLCWNSNTADVNLYTNANILSFMPDDVMTTEETEAGITYGPGIFYVQRVKNDDGTTNPRPTIPVDGEDGVLEINNTNFPGTQWLNNYSVYTTSLVGGQKYRVLYYEGCGVVWMREFYLIDQSSVTIQIGDGSYVQCTTASESVNGLTTSSINHRIPITATGTAIEEGSFSISPKELLSTVTERTETDGQIIYTTYLDIDAYKARLKTEDDATFFLNFTFRSGECWNTTTKEFMIHDNADPNFSVSSLNGSTEEPRIFCRNDEGAYPLSTEHPLKSGSSVDRVPGYGYFEVTMQGVTYTANAVGRNLGLEFVYNNNFGTTQVEYYAKAEVDAALDAAGEILPNAIIVQTIDGVDYYTKSAVATEFEALGLNTDGLTVVEKALPSELAGQRITNVPCNGDVTDDMGQFYFNPENLSPGIYNINYIFRSESGDCPQTIFKQYYVAPKHEYQKDTEIEYCPFYVDKDGNYKENWLNNEELDANGNSLNLDLLTNNLQFQMQDLDQNIYGYYNFKIAHATNSSITYDLEITNTVENGNYRANAGNIIATHVTTTNYGADHKVYETAQPQDGWVVTASLPISYVLSTENTVTDGTLPTASNIKQNTYIYVLDKNGNDITGRPLPAGTAVTSNACDNVIAKIVPIKHKDYQMEFDLVNACEGKENGSVTLTNLKKNGEDVEITSTAFSYAWFDYGTNGENLSSDVAMPNNEYSYRNLPTGQYILLMTDNATGCVYKSAVQVVDEVESVDFVLHITEPYNCCTGDEENCTAIGSAAIDHVSNSNFNVVWSQRSGSEFPTHNTNIQNLTAGYYSVSVYSGDNEECSNTLEFEIKALPDITSTDVPVEVSCKGAQDGQATITFTNLQNVAEYTLPAPAGAVNYVQYRAFNSKVNFIIVEKGNAVDGTSSGWKKVADYATAQNYDITGFNIRSRVTYTAGAAADETTLKDGQIVVSNTLQVDNLVAGDYTIWYMYEDYPNCIYSHDFTITEPDKDLKIVRYAVEDVNCKCADPANPEANDINPANCKLGSIQVTKMEGGNVVQQGTLTNYTFKLYDGANEVTDTYVVADKPYRF